MTMVVAKQFLSTSLLALTMVLGACSDSSDGDDFVAAPVAPDEGSVYDLAHGCFAVSPADNGVLATADDGYQLVDIGLGEDSHFRLQPSGLGRFLLYDESGNYLVGSDSGIARQAQLASDTNMVDGEVVITDRLQSEGEWEVSAAVDGRFNFKHLASGTFLTADATLGQTPADITLLSREDCAEFPELTLDATGTVTVTEFENGDLFGFVDAHSHLFTNYGFGGSGLFHGAPFHPLGVPHALPSCKLVHGEGGRKDFFGSGFSGDSIVDLAPALISGELPEDTHSTDGYPLFTDWPDAPGSSTHQMQYYKWIERAHHAGLRLMVQHATTQETVCQLLTSPEIGAQPLRYSCNDMVAVDRIIEATYDMERYIDAQSGGPGEGWFRIVLTPEEAREQIRDGKMAVVLGIETSDLFDCFLTARGDAKRCTEADVVAKLDDYHARGVRVLFPVHKMDNGFSAGDGDRRVSDIGNFAHSGHYSNFIPCPEELLTFPGGFDRGGVNFADLNQPRDVYDPLMSPVNPEDYDANPLGFFLTYVSQFLGGGALEGEYCQNAGLTSLGEFLIKEMMKRGMVIEVDHFSRQSYKRAYEILGENDYPAVGTHGRDYNGRLYELGGVSTSSFGRCRDPEKTSTMDDRFQSRLDLMREKGAYPGLGFGFDLNGFAGAPRARFGERANCSAPQTDKGVTYPFTSYAGDVVFQQPMVGTRTIDFNTEGMAHLGLVAEYIEDTRLDGVLDEDIEALFRSAEGYIRVWERSVKRSLDIASQ